MITVKFPLMRFLNDPLLFIESIPSKETRIFIERVITNYWIYQDRFSNVNRSLELVVKGQWPSYQSSSGVGVELAEDKKKRVQDYESN